MSATGRGAKRREADYYPTPPWCVERLLERVPELLRVPLCLEPCVGDGAILRGFPEGDRVWSVNDTRETSLATGSQRVESSCVGEATDFLDLRCGGGNSDVLAITNPPFLAAQSILSVSWARCDYVAFLLRCGFPATRGEWWNKWENRPNTYYIPDRPHFDGKGSDATEYAWFVWGLDPEPIGVLKHTPLSVRKAADAEARAILASMPIPEEQQFSLF